MRFDTCSIGRQVGIGPARVTPIANYCRAPGPTARCDHGFLPLRRHTPDGSLYRSVRKRLVFSAAEADDRSIRAVDIPRCAVTPCVWS
jgi:hypothetical protein